MAANPAPDYVSFAEADRRLGGLLSTAFQGTYATVALCDGDVVLDGDFLDGVGTVVDLDRIDVVVITGDLAVAGRIALYDRRPGLYVGGCAWSETIEGGDAEVYVNHGNFAYLVYGYYNDGVLEIGKATVPWVINSDHDLRVEAPEAILVDNFGVNAAAHFDARNIAASFVPEVVDPDGYLIVAEFLDHLRGDEQVLRAGVTVPIGRRV